MNDDTVLPLILLVEDNDLIAESLKECIERDLPATVVVAKHLEEAKAKIRAGINRFAGLSVDVMLPRDQEGLEQLRLLDAKRAKALADLAEETHDDVEYLNQSVATLRYKIDDLDQEIYGLLAMEGGLEFLEWFSDQLYPGQDPDNRAPLDLPVVIYTARGLAEPRVKCERIVKKVWLKWVEKVIDEKVIVNAFKQFLAGRRDATLVG